MKEKLTETVYRPDSLLLNPVALFKNMMKDLINSRELAWRLFIRNINAQYRQTILGYLWAFIPPVFVSAIWIYLNSQKIFNIENTSMPYTLFVLTGTILWQTFVDAINSPIKIVNESKSMLTKINFPKEALIIAGLGEVLLNFLIRVLLLIIMYSYYSYPVMSTLIFVPFGIISIIVLGIMIGLLLTPFSILYNDINRGIIIVTQVWFFLTPVIYPVPVNTAQSILKLNPVTPLIVTTRDWIATGNSLFLNQYIIISILSCLFLFIAWIIYKLSMPHLISRISS